MGRATSTHSALDLACEWLRKDKVTHALRADQRLEAVVEFNGSIGMGTITSTSFCLTIDSHEGGKIRFTMRPYPKDLTREWMRHTTPKDEIEGYHWLIERGQRQKNHMAWGKKEVVPAIDEFCTLHDAVLYLCEVYT